ncbi:hypothetical protein PVK06_034889 [Gossypium arboreum]|uniref:Uncharacterized protein n=1 Tax=Gossypium arboreum TaxID=29729 RepID=A0ABR0NFG1_GOSAR|nr:hypothetical protein PVK06_034889 [Gossypium arboreum]
MRKKKVEMKRIEKGKKPGKGSVSRAKAHSAASSGPILGPHRHVSPHGRVRSPHGCVSSANNFYYFWTFLLGEICLLKGVNKNTLIQDGKEMASVLYTYRSCVKALPQGVCWNSQFGIQKLSAETGAASIYCGFWF